MPTKDVKVTVKFTRGHMVSFERLSHDRNPLHVDERYARYTQFGKPVVYGMCAVLLGLGQWANGRSFRIIEIHGQFGKPLFEGEEYELVIVDGSKQVKVQYLKGSTVQSTFSFTWETRASEEQHAHGSWFQPLATADNPNLGTALERWQGGQMFYCHGSDCVPELLAAFDLEPGQIPANQINALLGSSYFVGMVLPGQQALYAGFKFSFQAVPIHSGGRNDRFEFRSVAVEQDERLNRLSITGAGTGIQSFRLNAFRRPKRVRYYLEDVRVALGKSDYFGGKTVFISGATRGFGSVLAQAFALQGARLILNYKSNREEAETLAREIRPHCAGLCLVGGDVSSEDACRTMREEIAQFADGIDLLVNNAFPQIPAMLFLEQSSKEFLSYVERSIATGVVLLHEFLPLVPKGGRILEISTIYTQFGQPQFAHYIAAKSALEGLMRALAKEFRAQQFVIARLPRMLTDQTNLAFDLAPAVSAIEVAWKLLDVFKKLDVSSNFVDLNIN